MQVTIIADDEGRARLMREAVQSSLPSSSVERRRSTTMREPISAACVVIDATQADAGIEALRVARATGFTGPLVALTARNDQELAQTAAGVGADVIPFEQMVQALPKTIAERIPDNDRVSSELRRAQRLQAAGALALRLQHSLNNPLAALLAEAQLLELESLAPEHREALHRIVELCRRVIALVRQLDGMQERPSPPA